MNKLEKEELENRILSGEKIKVTYEMFGASGDGIKDDYDAIREAHNFVNRLYVNHGVLLTVHAVKGHTYYLCDSHNVPISIATNVDWEGANFIVDDNSLGDDVKKLKDPLFQVVSPMRIATHKSTVNYKDGDILNSAKFSPYIKNAKEFVNTFLECIVRDDNNSKCKKFFDDSRVIGVVVKNSNSIYLRNGGKSGIEQQDIILIDKESGDILSDIEWNYDDIKEIMVWPIPNEKITIKGGNFLTVTNNRCVDNSGNKFYVNRAIFVNSTGNVVLENINHYLDERNGYTSKNKERENANSYLGFIRMTRASFIDVNSVYLTPHTYPCLIGDNGKKEYRGSYDLHLENSQNININGLKCDDSDMVDKSKWGVMASKGSKNVCIMNSSMNRIDAHEGIHNLAVVNSIIGYRGITLTGSGNFHGKDLTFYGSNHLISLREDFGSTWKGDIYLENINFYPSTLGDVKLIESKHHSDKNYGYNTYFPAISMKNVLINNPSSDVCIMTMNDVSENNSNPYHFSGNLYFNNVRFNANNGHKLYLLPNSFVKKEANFNAGSYLGNSVSVDCIDLDDTFSIPDNLKYSNFFDIYDNSVFKYRR